MNKRYSRRARTAGCFAATVFAALAAPVAAYAQQQNSFDIPAQDLGSALRTFGQQAQQQIAFDGAAVRGKTSAAVRGNFAADEALSRLLAGTGMTVSRTAGGVLAVRGEVAPATGFNDIVVTARRVEENLQRVPIAITAFTPEALAQSDTRDMTSLVRNLPGVNFCCSTFNTALTVVRGITNGAPSYFADAPVAGTGFGNFFDVSHVEVLKGPQGTLFGQASNGGAFVYQPRKPGEVLGGYLGGSAGTFDRRSIEGAVDLPLFDGRVLTRFAGTSYYRDGFIHDISSGKNYGDQDYYVLQPSMTLRLTDNLENYTIYRYQHARDNGNANLWVAADFNFQPPGQVASVGNQAAAHGGRAAFDALRAQVILAQQQLGPYKVLGSSVGCATERGPVWGPTSPTVPAASSGGPPAPNPITSLNYTRAACPENWREDNLVVNTTAWSFADNWSIRNIASYNWGRQFAQPADGDNTPLMIQDGGNPRNNSPTKTPRVWSDEIQLRGQLGLFDFTAGAFHTGRVSVPVVTYGQQFGSTQTASISKTSATTHAVYGQTNIDLGGVLENLTATLGARYTWDKVTSINFSLDPGTLALRSITGGPNSPAGLGRFENLAYTAGLQYQYTPETMFYLTNARGYSAGGLQNVVGFERFEPDVLTNLEAGVKSTFDVGGVQARIDASYYYGWYEDVKVFVYRLVTNSVTGVTAAGGMTDNAAEARIQGVDANLSLLLTDNLEVGGFVALSDPKYTSWPSRDPLTLAPVDLSSTPFLFTPKWKWGLRAQYRLPVDQAWGDISVGANYSYRTKLVEVSSPLTPTDPANPRTGHICTRQRTTANGYPASIADNATVWVDCREPQSNLDMNVTWRRFLGHENLFASLAVTNVTENVVTDNQCTCDSASGFTGPQPAPPRMAYVTLRYEF